MHKPTLSTRIDPFLSPFQPHQKPYHLLRPSLLPLPQIRPAPEEDVIEIPYKENFKHEPLEKFDEELVHDMNPEELLKNGPIRGFSRWHEADNRIAWKECTICEYDRKENQYLIQWNNTGTFKKVKRLNLMFEADCENTFQQRVDFAKTTRLKKLYMGTMESTT